MEKKGQVVVGTILAVIVAVVIISVVWNFTQGASGDLLIKNEAITATNNTGKALTYEFTSIAKVQCTNGTTLTGGGTDYFELPTRRLLFNGTNVCGNFSSTQNWLVDYNYHNQLYLGGNSGLTRTILSYSIIGLILAVLLVAFYLGTRE